jgi:hypothetical protein
MSAEGLPETQMEVWRMNDVALARALNGKTVDSTSYLWPRIGELQRKGLLRLRVISRYAAETTAAGEAA